MGADTQSGAAGGQRRWTVAAVVLGLAVLGGCNPGIMLAFMFPADPNLPPKCPLTIEGKESKVVILTTHTGGGPESALLSRVDWDLTARLHQLLQERFKENKDKVVVVPPSQVRGYQNTHHRWRDEPPQKLGEHFKADFVISLEIEDFRLMDKRSPTLYQGHAEISVTVTDAHKPVGEGEVFFETYATDFPRTPTSVSDMSANQFRTQLINAIAKDLVQMFTPHPPRDRFGSP
jgi:hypothetical protein